MNVHLISDDNVVSINHSICMYNKCICAIDNLNACGTS